MMLEASAHAKINLHHRVLERREDGYHEIETIFLPLRLFDRIRLSLQSEPGVRLQIRGADLPAGPDNLAWRAAERTLEALDEPRGVAIELEKQIPVLNAVFTPDEAAVALAQRIVAAFEAAETGLVVVDGKLIEKPVLRDMHRILAIADRIAS